MSRLYARIFLQILDSSIADDYTTRHVFVDFLMLAENGIVDMTREALSRRLNIPLDVLNKAIGKLEAPDPRSRNPEHGGRRIGRLDSHRDWGWLILNWDFYESIRSREESKQKARERKLRFKEKHDQDAAPPLDPPGEETEKKRDREGAFPKRSKTFQSVPPATDKDLQQHGCKNHPSVEACKLLAAKSGMPESEGEKFFNFYESNGWLVGKARNPMKSWHGSMANWKLHWQAWEAERRPRSDDRNRFVPPATPRGAQP